jgi:glycosyltransferase involved in cell wall biosynthesis
MNSAFPAAGVHPSMTALTPKPQLAVVVPCFNEARHIVSLVGALRPMIPLVLVVDDGSTDETARLAAGAGADVLRQAENRGKGAALRKGLRAALDAGCEYAVTMDGDGQHDPADLTQFIAAADGGEVDLVIGNRMAAPRSMPWLRRQVNRWMSRRISRLAGRTLPDTQCGYRLIRLSAWQELELHTTGFEIESEMLLSFIAAGLRVEFVPVRTIYKTEQSKIHPVRDTIRWFRWWRQVKQSRRRG